MEKYVFGDIHGCYNELASLINEIHPNFGVDKLIFLGDYIDRGTNSYKVVRFLMDLQSKYGRDNIILLRGNHEDMAIDYILSSYTGNQNGYRSTYDDFLRNGDDISNYLDFFQSLPLYHEDDNFIYVHGGIRPYTPMSEQ
jgi:serine/threonine protein phosphatase 1